MRQKQLQLSRDNIFFTLRTISRTMNLLLEQIRWYDIFFKKRDSAINDMDLVLQSQFLFFIFYPSLGGWGYGEGALG